MAEPLWGVRRGMEYGWGCKGGDGRGDLGPEAVALCVWGVECGMWGVVCGAWCVVRGVWGGMWRVGCGISGRAAVDDVLQML